MTSALHPFRLETRADNSVVTPGPGVYPNTPMDHYHAWNAVSNSRFSELDRSPAHLRAYLDSPPDDTAATLAGRAIHCAVLEPDDFAARFVVAEQCGATTKKLEQCSKTGSLFHPTIGWRCGTHGAEIAVSLAGGPTVLRPDDYTMCLGIRDSILRHKSIAALLARRTATELSIVWRHGDVLCKARLDGLVTVADGAIIDLKSTGDARKDAFERAIFAYGYHRQGALYLEGTDENDLDAKHFINIAMEKDAPYEMAPYRLREDAIAAGWQQLDRLFPVYADCVATNTWPGYKDEVVDISLPPWAWDKIDVTTMEKAS